MNRTKIEWCDYSINPVKGLCPMACPYCYARRMYKRFKWNPKVRYEDVFWYPGIKGKPGDKYFIGSTMELFGDWIEEWWLKSIFDWVTSYPQRTFIFLTKQPQNLIKWSPFPDNCWVGVSVTNQKQFGDSQFLAQIEAKVRFISFEPLLERIYQGGLLGSFSLPINWLIIGQKTPASVKTPNPEWIQEIIDAGDQAGVPIFIKNNILKDKAFHWLKGNWNRQEFPK